MEKFGGYEKINRDLVDELKLINIVNAASTLGLDCNQSGQAQIDFLGRIYLLGTNGINAKDGHTVEINHGSVLAGYLLKRGSGEPAGKFVPLTSLTGMVPAQNSYVNNTLESQIAKYAQQDQTVFEETIIKFGGTPGGEKGSGGKSWIIELLPKIPAQLIFYDGDDEFPPEVCLLFDITAVNFLEFEFLAVLATIFVEEIIKKIQYISKK